MKLNELVHLHLNVECAHDRVSSVHIGRGGPVLIQKHKVQNVCVLYKLRKSLAIVISIDGRATDLEVFSQLGAQPDLDVGGRHAVLVTTVLVDAVVAAFHQLRRRVTCRSQHGVSERVVWRQCAANKALHQCAANSMASMSAQNEQTAA